MKVWSASRHRFWASLKVALFGYLFGFLLIYIILISLLFHFTFMIKMIKDFLNLTSFLWSVITDVFWLMNLFNNHQYLESITCWLQISRYFWGFLAHLFSFFFGFLHLFTFFFGFLHLFTFFLGFTHFGFLGLHWLLCLETLVSSDPFSFSQAPIILWDIPLWEANLSKLLRSNNGWRQKWDFRLFVVFLQNIKWIINYRP